MVLPLTARSISVLAEGSLSETALPVNEAEGEGGGGMETELGRRARGVPGPFLVRVGVP